MGRVGGRHRAWPSHLQKRLENDSVRFGHLNKVNDDDRPVILIFLLLHKEG